jgi:hypothetical protein
MSSLTDHSAYRPPILDELREAELDRGEEWDEGPSPDDYADLEPDRYESQWTKQKRAEEGAARLRASGFFLDVEDFLRSSSPTLFVRHYVPGSGGGWGFRVSDRGRLVVRDWQHGLAPGQEPTVRECTR